MKCVFSRLYVCLLFGALQGGASAADISLTASDSGAASSFNTAGSWSNGQAPQSTNDYFTSTFVLQTPNGAAASTFLGNSLTLDSGGSLVYAGPSGGSITVNDLSFAGGSFGMSNAGGTDYPMFLYGNISLPSATTSTVSSTRNAVRRTINMYADISGNGHLRLEFRRWFNFFGSNTYRGDTIIETYTPAECVTTYEAGSSSVLVINGDGDNSQIRGNGALVMNGLLNLDVANAVGKGSWVLIDTNNLQSLSYGASFSLSTTAGGNFQENAGVWTIGQTWVYTEATGVLERFLPPGTLITLQ